MARCAATGKKLQFGNNVSHANNKTRRVWLPNVRQVSILSDVLGMTVRLNLSTHGLRSVEHNGGIDNWLLKTTDAKLGAEGVKLKRRIKKALAKQKKAA